MEINRFQIREMALLAQEAGPAALKGLSDVEKRALKVMMEALQKKDHAPVKLRGLNEHQFKLMKEYLAWHASVRQEGHAIATIPTRRSEKLAKGIKNIAARRISSARLEKEINKAIGSMRTSEKPSKSGSAIHEHRSKIDNAKLRISTIKNETQIEEQVKMRDFFKKLDRKISVYSITNDISDKKAEVSNDLHELLSESADVFRRSTDLQKVNYADLFENAAWEVRGGSPLSQKTIGDIESVLRSFPDKMKKFELFLNFMNNLDDISVASPSQRDQILKEAIAAHENAINQATKLLEEQKKMIEKSEAAMAKPVKQQAKGAKVVPSAREEKLKALNTELALLQKKTATVMNHGAEIRSKFRQQIRDEWLEIKRDPNELTSKQLNVRIRRIKQEFKRLDPMRTDPMVAIRRQELFEHLKDLRTLRDKKDERLINKRIEGMPPDPDLKQGRLLKFYRARAASLQKQKAKLEIR